MATPNKKAGKSAQNTGFSARDLRSAEQSAKGSPALVARKIHAAVQAGKILCNEVTLWLQSNFSLLKSQLTGDLYTWLCYVTGNRAQTSR